MFSFPTYNTKIQVHVVIVFFFCSTRFDIRFMRTKRDNISGICYVLFSIKVIDGRLFSNLHFSKPSHPLKFNKELAQGLFFFNSENIRTGASIWHDIISLSDQAMGISYGDAYNVPKMKMCVSVKRNVRSSCVMLH